MFRSGETRTFLFFSRIDSLLTYDLFFPERPMAMETQIGHGYPTLNNVRQPRPTPSPCLLSFAITLEPAPFLKSQLRLCSTFLSQQSGARDVLLFSSACGLHLVASRPHCFLHLFGSVGHTSSPFTHSFDFFFHRYPQSSRISESLPVFLSCSPFFNPPASAWHTLDVSAVSHGSDPINSQL